MDTVKFKFITMGVKYQYPIGNLLCFLKKIKQKEKYMVNIFNVSYGCSNEITVRLLRRMNIPSF